MIAMSRNLMIAAALTGGALAVAALPAAAHAIAQAASANAAKATVDAAKAQGIVGEAADGYVAIRLEAQATAEIRAAVAQMNAGRAQLYAQAAQRTGVQTAAAGAASFNERFGDIPAGQWWRDTSGAWQRK